MNKFKIIASGLVICFILSAQAKPLFARANELKKAEASMLKGAYAQALRECKKVLADSRKSSVKARALYLSGVCLLKEERFSEARESFKKVVHKYPHSKSYDDAQLGVANSYFLAGDFPRATQMYQQFLDEFPRSALSSIARKHLALCKEGKVFDSSYFSVQVGCFSRRGNAYKLRDRLIDSGFQAYILQRPEERIYRVRVGKFSRKLAAGFLERELKAEGFDTKICP